MEHPPKKILELIKDWTLMVEAAIKRDKELAIYYTGKIKGAEKILEELGYDYTPVNTYI